MQFRAVFACLLVTLIAPALGAQRIQSEESTLRQLERWTEDLQTAHRELLEDKVKRAEERTEKTRRQLLERLRGGPAAPHLLGQVSFLRALAAAKTGDVVAAEWDFHVALAFVKGYDNLDLGPYGEAGAILEQARTGRRERLERERLRRETEAEDEPGTPVEEVTPPRKKSAPQPIYPLAHKVSCGEGRVVLQAIIDEEGRVAQPEIKEAGDPILLFVAFGAVRKWEFEPARRGGEPVAVYYNLVVNFRVGQNCVSPLDPLPRVNARPPLG